MSMDRGAVLEHWESWARTYGSELRATTKCETIKLLEIEAFVRWIGRLHQGEEPVVLELGCGNGINGFALAERHSGLRYIGVDFSEAMISNALSTVDRHAAGVSSAARLAFGVADVRKLTMPLVLDESSPHGAGEQARGLLPLKEADFAITDRMLINLGSPQEQLDAMRRIAELVRKGGHFLMLENSAQTHASLNRIRAALDLDPRQPAPFNVFIDEDAVIATFSEEMELVAVDDFSAIHDLILYAVQPALRDGEVEYDTPLLQELTAALVAIDAAEVDRRGAFGQNRLWVWRRD